MSRKKPIIRIRKEEVDVQRKKLNSKHKCKYCNNHIFESKELLEQHLAEAHGRFSKEVHREARGIDPTIHSIYMQFYGGEKKPDPKTSWRHPDRKDWNVQLGNINYWWNPWSMEYCQYKLGIGVISNDLHYVKDEHHDGMVEMVIADENSDYYKVWRDLVAGDRKKIPAEPTKPKMHPIPFKKYIEDELPANYLECKVCGKAISVLLVSNHTILCGGCGWEISGKGYEKWLEQQREKGMDVNSEVKNWKYKEVKTK